MLHISNLINCISIYNTADKNNNTPVDKTFKQFARNITLLLAFGGALSGCTMTNNLNNTKNETAIITSSVNQHVKPEGLNEADAEQIKNAVVQIKPNHSNADGTGTSSALMAWSNPETGNTGTITAINDYIGTHGQSCKKFRTTVDSFMGIALYNGETCELKKGFWVLSWFIRDVAT